MSLKLICFFMERRSAQMEHRARAIFPALLLLLSLRTAPAAQTNWTTPSLGDWFISSNWTNSLVPNPTTDGIIANGGAALLNAPSAEAQQLFIGVRR